MASMLGLRACSSSVCSLGGLSYHTIVSRPFLESWHRMTKPALSSLSCCLVQQCFWNRYLPYLPGTLSSPGPVSSLKPDLCLHTVLLSRMAFPNTISLHSESSQCPNGPTSQISYFLYMLSPNSNSPILEIKPFWPASSHTAVCYLQSPSGQVQKPWYRAGQDGKWV